MSEKVRNKMRFIGEYYVYNLKIMYLKLYYKFYKDIEEYVRVVVYGGEENRGGE